MFFLLIFNISVNFKIFAYLSLTIIVVMLINYFLSKNIARPLEKMVVTAKEFARGDFSDKIKSSNILEINSLASSLNLMRKQLNERIKLITIQKNENDAILTSMTEGVIATNKSNEIIKINSRSIEFFSLKDDVIGIDIRTIIRNKEFLDFYNKIVNLEQSKNIDCTIENINKRTILCSGTILKDKDGLFIGNVIVVNDITKLKSFEIVKKEFVANVSHELKTPLTALKGYVETLREVENEKDRIYFLDILDKHTSRMDLIIDDLLELSRLEESSNGLAKSKINILELINDSMNECQYSCLKKDIELNVRCDKSITFNLNKRLIQESIVNLIQNAIQYSEKNSKITISSFVDDGYLKIEVKDSGIGIEKNEIKNIFKRFYCVDRSRSKDNGGTGLGLSIVKHIISLHNGKIDVQSKIGKGSNFILIIPEG